MKRTRIRFADHFRVKHGYAFKSEHFADEGPFALLTPGNFNEEGGFRNRGDKQPYYTGEVPPAYILAKGDVIIAMTEQDYGLLDWSIRHARPSLLHRPRLLAAEHRALRLLQDPVAHLAPMGQAPEVGCLGHGAHPARRPVL